MPDDRDGELMGRPLLAGEDAGRRPGRADLRRATLDSLATLGWIALMLAVAHRLGEGWGAVVGIAAVASTAISLRRRLRG